ncbi:MAG: hypothetical protein KBB14_14950 [Thermoanaerobaculia bacterium]|nr:hypothetical protein [Thermoanaerobaculia bacterium]
MAERRGRRKGRPGDGLEPDFGPGFDPAEAAPADAGTGDRAPDTGSRIPCGKDGCLLKPIGDLAARFALELARRGHSESAARAATSGIELLRAMRDFLDEEIALAERAAEARRTAGRYTKIPVE